MTIPKLNQAGGYDPLRCLLNSQSLMRLQHQFTPLNLKETVGNARVYITTNLVTSSAQSISAPCRSSLTLSVQCSHTPTVQASTSIPSSSSPQRGKCISVSSDEDSVPGDKQQLTSDMFPQRTQEQISFLLDLFHKDIHQVVLKQTHAVTIILRQFRKMQLVVDHLAQNCLTLYKGSVNWWYTCC